MSSSHPQRSGTCANCAQPAPQNFCPSCGQNTHIETPTLFEFVHEYLHHYVALDGTLTRSLWKLLTRPGALTVEYLAGRRQSYIKPLQLYLSISFIFFVLLGLFGPSLKFNQTDGSGKSALSGGNLHEVSAANRAKPQVLSSKLAESLAELPEDGDEAEPAQKAQEPLEVVREIKENMGKPVGGLGKNSLAYSWVDRLNTKLQAYQVQPRETLEEVRKDAMHKLPYAVFALMPVFAFLLWLAYFRRRMVYGSHLVFALHVHAFTFLLFMLCLLPMAAAKMSLLVLPVYLIAAMRKVYGGRWRAQTWRALFLLGMYSVAALIALAVLLLSLV